VGRDLIALTIAFALGCGGARPAPTPDRATDFPRTADTEEASRSIPDEVRVRVIFVTFEGRTERAAEERARMLARTARADDFSALAASYGDGENTESIGASGLIIRQNDPRIPAAVVNAALALHLRQISEPIRSDEGYWVLQRVE
jgi:parvulin-like peptidyl-prolyl isomerase